MTCKTSEQPTLLPFKSTRVRVLELPLGTPFFFPSQPILMAVLTTMIILSVGRRNAQQNHCYYFRRATRGRGISAHFNNENTLSDIIRYDERRRTKKKTRVCLEYEYRGSAWLKAGYATNTMGRALPRAQTNLHKTKCMSYGSIQGDVWLK